MQLDKTRIAIRERGGIDTFDLTLHVLRVFAPRLIPALLVGIVPLAVLDYFLIGWIDEPQEYRTEDSVFRYLWNYTLLVFLQGPAATIFGVAYLGGAVFRHERTILQVIRDVFSVLPGFFLCQMLLRGSLLAIVMPLFYDHEFNGLLEGFGLTVACLVAGGLRSMRPYINEIVVLERNPLWPRNSNTMTMGRRSGFLHGPSGGDLFALWLGSALVAMAAAGIIWWSLYVIYLIMVGNTDPLSRFSLHIAWPVAIWTVVAYMGVARFLGYLDLRIRQEGWEVELLIKAESVRMAHTLA